MSEKETPIYVTQNHRCPKCNGLTYGNFFSEFKLSRCATCGLLHHLGSSKESLEKQILGDDWQNPRGVYANG